MSLELHAIFSGRVQGVGFRWTVSALAATHQLSGTVKNLENGKVEVYAVGSKEKLEAFVDGLKAHPGAARIDSVHCSYQAAHREYKGFQIKY